MAIVSNSSKNTVPRATATTGLAKVINPARASLAANTNSTTAASVIRVDQAVISAPSMPAKGLSPGKKPRWLGNTSSGD